MCLNPLYFIVFPVIHNSLIYWTCVLNPLTWAIVPLPPCHWSCSLLTFISVLKVVIWKLLVKSAVYNCKLAHSTNQSKNRRMPEAMATKTWSQENHQVRNLVTAAVTSSSCLMRKSFSPFFFSATYT